MITDVLLGFLGIAALAGIAVWVAPWMLRGWRGTWVRLALLTTRDGRYAVRLADGLQAVIARIRHAARAMESDPAERQALSVMLRQFSRDELNALLWQVHLLLATGDTERIRALHPKIESETERWSALADPAERDRAASHIAELRHELDTRRQTGRAWASIVKGMEQAHQDLEGLERELVTLSVAKHQPLTAFRARIGESVEHLRRLRTAHTELDSLA